MKYLLTTLLTKVIAARASCYTRGGIMRLERQMNSPWVALVLALGLLPASAATAGVLHVPADFPTIQEAVDAAQPYDTIKVATGDYQGAVIDQFPVAIRGSGAATRITKGNDNKFWPGEDAFDIFGETAWKGYCNDINAPEASWIPCGGDGTQITDLSIGGTLLEEGPLWGVYAEGAEDLNIRDLTITNVRFGVIGNYSDRMTVKGVSVTGDVSVTGWFIGIRSIWGDGCTITGNEIRDFPSGHANGIIVWPVWPDDCSVEGNCSVCSVKNNTVYHVGEAVCDSDCGLIDEYYTGIHVGQRDGGSEYISVKDNRVTIAVTDPYPKLDRRLISTAMAVNGSNHTVKDNKLTGIGTDGVCRTAKMPDEWPFPGTFYDAGCIALGPEAEACSAPSTPLDCNTFKDNELQVLVNNP